MKRILVLAPHTDDAEFGCGGTIAKFVEEGKEVFCVAFSAAEDSIPEDLPKDTNRKDMIGAMNILGVQEQNIKILNYQVRKFPEFRQKILDDMLSIQNEIKPDIVFLPSTYDTHQDHQVISQEGFRAYKKITIMGYEVPWNNLTFTTNSFILLSESNLEKKINSLKCYISQLGRSYVDDDFIRSLARTRGVQMGDEYAEAFEVIRWIIK